MTQGIKSFHRSRKPAWLVDFFSLSFCIKSLIKPVARRGIFLSETEKIWWEQIEFSAKNYSYAWVGFFQNLCSETIISINSTRRLREGYMSKLWFYSPSENELLAVTILRAVNSSRTLALFSPTATLSKFRWEMDLSVYWAVFLYIKKQYLTIGDERKVWNRN